MTNVYKNYELTVLDKSLNMLLKLFEVGCDNDPSRGCGHVSKGPANGT